MSEARTRRQVMEAFLPSSPLAVTWSDATIPDQVAGSTATLHVDDVAPARGKDLRAVARTVKRGRRL